MSERVGVEQTPGIEALAKVLRGCGFWATHSDRWNDEAWQAELWSTLATAVASSEWFAAAVREARAAAWDEGYDARGVDIANEGLTERTLTLNPYRTVDVTECPDCGERGHYDRRVTAGGRGIYSCPNLHQWQDANETPDSKGYVRLETAAEGLRNTSPSNGLSRSAEVSDRADRIAVDAPEGGA